MTEPKRAAVPETPLCSGSGEPQSPLDPEPVKPLTVPALPHRTALDEPLTGPTSPLRDEAVKPQSVSKSPHHPGAGQPAAVPHTPSHPASGEPAAVPDASPHCESGTPSVVPESFTRFGNAAEPTAASHRPFPPAPGEPPAGPSADPVSARCEPPLPHGLFVEPPISESAAARWTTEEERTRAAAFGSARRRREWLGWRALVRRELGADTQIGYDASGAPVLTNRRVHVGVAHCAGRIAVCLSDRPCAVDIEPENRNFLRAAPRYLTPEERALSDDPLLPGIVWCAKETLYKYAGRPQLDLLRDIRIERIESPDQIEEIERAGRIDRFEQIKQSGKVEKTKEADPFEPAEQSESPGQTQRAESPEEAARFKGIEKIEEVEVVEEADGIERADGYDGVEGAEPTAGPKQTVSSESVDPADPTVRAAHTAPSVPQSCLLVGRIAGGPPVRLTLLRREGYLIVFIR